MIANFELVAFTPGAKFELLEVGDPGPAVPLAQIIDARARTAALGAHMEGDLEVLLPEIDAIADWAETLAVAVEATTIDGVAEFPEELDVVFGIIPIDGIATFPALVIEEPVLSSAVDTIPSWERPVSRAVLLEAFSVAGGS